MKNMYSLIFISLYIIISLIVLGKTTSISATHYKWLEKYNPWGYLIFPISMIIWGALVSYEAPELIISVMGIWYVAVYAMFKYNTFISFAHYIGVVIATVNLMIHVNNWNMIGIITILSIVALLSKYRLYIIEVLIIIMLYVYINQFEICLQVK